MPLELNLPADYYQASMTFTGTGCPRGAAIVFGGQAAALAPATIAGAVNSAWTSALRAQFSADVTMAGTRVKKGPMDDGPFAFVALSSAGTASGTAMAPSVAYLIRKNTAIGGRQGAGRIYQPGVAEGSVDAAGIVSGAVRTPLQAGWDAFLAALNSAGAPMFLLHSFGAYTVLRDKDPFIVVVAARAPTAVTSLTVDSKVATQRRRLRG